MAHDGAPRWLLLLHSRAGEKRDRGRDIMEGGLGSGAALLTRRRGQSGRGPPSPVYGCHVVAVGGVEAGTSARGEEGESWAARASGPKGRRVGSAAAASFPFF